MNNEVYDPVELVKDLADKIGIHQLYAIAREIRGEGDTAVEPGQVAEMKANIDYLSRQKAIDAVFNNAEHPDKAYGAIRHLPSAQPERKTGRWIETEGLDEKIRCTMCTNPMRSDRGCDGSCQYDEKLYKQIMSIIEDRIDGGGA